MVVGPLASCPPVATEWDVFGRCLGIRPGLGSWAGDVSHQITGWFHRRNLLSQRALRSHTCEVMAQLQGNQDVFVIMTCPQPHRGGTVLLHSSIALEPYFRCGPHVLP
jgi:hypothetical protein